MDLIMRCLSNNPQQRPRAEEIVNRTGDVVLQYPPSSENRVEMLQRISTLNTEKRELEQEIVRRGVIIEEKRRQNIENESTIERIRLASTVEIDQKVIENEHLRGQLEVQQTLVRELRAQSNPYNTMVSQIKVQMEVLTAQVGELAAQVAALDEVRAQYCLLTARDIVREADMTAMESSLQNSEDTIQSVFKKLDETRGYLTTKPQPLQFQVAYTQQSARSPVVMSKGTAISIKDKVYYGGGYCEMHGDDCLIYCYTPSQDKWSTLPKLPVCYFGMGKINNELVAVGGLKSVFIRTNKILHLHTPHKRAKKWSELIKPIPTGRESPAVVSLSSHLVVAGGKVGQLGKPSDDVEIYNINTSQWSKTDRLPYACSDPKTAVCNNKLYLVGGEDCTRLEKVVTAQIDQLIANSVRADQQKPKNGSDHDSAWKEIADTPSYRPSAVAVSDSSTVLTIGGADSAGEKLYAPTQGIYAYSSSMDSWLYIGDLPSPIAFAAIVSLSPSEFLMIGGQDNPPHWQKLDTVYKATITASLN